MLKGRRTGSRKAIIRNALCSRLLCSRSFNAAVTNTMLIIRSLLAVSSIKHLCRKLSELPDHLGRETMPDIYALPLERTRIASNSGAFHGRNIYAVCTNEA